MPATSSVGVRFGHPPIGMCVLLVVDDTTVCLRQQTIAESESLVVFRQSWNVD